MNPKLTTLISAANMHLKLRNPSVAAEIYIRLLDNPTVPKRERAMVLRPRRRSKTMLVRVEVGVFIERAAPARRRRASSTREPFSAVVMRRCCEGSPLACASCAAAAAIYRAHVSSSAAAVITSNTRSPLTLVLPPRRSLATMAMVQVQIPAGVGPGRQFMAQMPDGQQMAVTVPDGCAPGQMIQVQAPMAMAVAQPAVQMMGGPGMMVQPGRW